MVEFTRFRFGTEYSERWEAEVELNNGTVVNVEWNQPRRQINQVRLCAANGTQYTLPSMRDRFKDMFEEVRRRQSINDARG